MRSSLTVGRGRAFEASFGYEFRDGARCVAVDAACAAGAQREQLPGNEIALASPGRQARRLSEQGSHRGAVFVAGTARSGPASSAKTRPARAAGGESGTVVTATRLAGSSRSRQKTAGCSRISRSSASRAATARQSEISRLKTAARAAASSA
jgi:hypothetical protein